MQNRDNNDFQILHMITNHAYAFTSGYCTSLHAMLGLKDCEAGDMQKAHIHLLTFGFIAYSCFLPNVEQPKSIRFSACVGMMTGLLTASYVTNDNYRDNDCTCTEESLSPKL